MKPVIAVTGKSSDAYFRIRIQISLGVVVSAAPKQEQNVRPAHQDLSVDLASLRLPQSRSRKELEFIREDVRKTEPFLGLIHSIPTAGEGQSPAAQEVGRTHRKRLP